MIPRRARIWLAILLAVLLCASLATGADFVAEWGAPLAWLIAPLTVLAAFAQRPTPRAVSLPRRAHRGRGPPVSLPY